MTFTDECDEARVQYCTERIHADGSHTFVSHEEHVESWMSPREDPDTDIVRMVQCHDRYVALDSAHDMIADARARWGDESPLVARYVAMFVDDVAYYEPRWFVQGNSQGDWCYGYAYILWDDLREVFSHPEWMVGGSGFKALVEVAVEAYQRYFAGDVYRVTHVAKGGPCYEIADSGGYYTGEYGAVVESITGYLADWHDKVPVIDLTTSPVVETITH